MSREIKKWKGKKCVLFRWKEYVGFYPHSTCLVLEETETECLVQYVDKWIFGTRKKEMWTLKYRKDVDKYSAKQCGYCKILSN